MHPHRPQPPRNRHGRRITELAIGYPGYNGIMPFENGILSEMLVRARLRHLRRRQVAPHAASEERRRSLRPLAARRGFERFYGFLGGDTNQYYPELVYDNHRVAPPATAEEGYHLTPDLVDKPSSSSPTPRQIDAGQAVLPDVCAGRDARAAPRAPGVGGPVRRPVRRGLGRVPRDASSAPTGARAWCRRRRALPPRPGRAGMGRARAPTRAGSTARMMEVFAGFLSHTDHHIGRLLDYLEHGRARQHASSWSCPTTAPAPRAARPAHQRGAVLQQRPETTRGEPGALDESAAPSTSTTTPGAGPGPATRRSAAGSARRYRGGVATRSSSHWPAGIAARGEVRTPVRARHRHGADRARRCSASSRRRRSRRDAVAHHGVSFAHTFDDADAPTPRTTRSTSRCSATLDRTTTGGGPSARVRAPRSPRPARLRQPVRRGSSTELDARAGSSTASTTTRREPRPRRRPPRQADRDDRDLVHRGGQVRRPADRRQRHRADGRRGASSRLPRDKLHLRTRARSRSRLRRATLLNRPHSITASVEIPETAPRACCSARAPPRAATRSSSRTASCTTCTTTSRGSDSTSRHPTGARGRHELRFEFEPTGGPDIAHGKGDAGQAQLYVNGTLVASVDARIRRRHVQPGRCQLRP